MGKYYFCINQYPMNQHFAYSISSSFSFFADIHTFSAKEKDTETGLSYFGSRYYSSDLSIWLSVDPMSDKYPHQSNYVYCSNNPIRITDPNGKDEYEFDECGYYVRTITNTNADIIHIVNGDGKRIASSQEFSYGSIVSQPENAIPSNNTNISDATMFQVSNEETAGGMFEFFASNTPVEWCVVSAESQNGECEYMIGTNHDEEHNNINSIITNRGFMIERSAHNHPNDINSVSKGDRENAYILERLNPNVQLYNFTKSNGYTRYTYRDGFVDDKGNSHFPMLMEIEVFGENKNR